jgi:2-polyprenyl-6-methoxyphenol hydroxylase-like FAD-dependent oxidoreductase
MDSKTSKMGGRSAVVVGGGIGGLTAAVALRRVGWQVTVLERAAMFGEIGAGITLLSNGLRCLDAIGLGDAVRGSGLPMLAALGMRTAAGRWLSRFDGDGADMEARMGTTSVVIHRAELHRILRDALPAAALVAGVATTGIITTMRCCTPTWSWVPTGCTAGFAPSAGRMRRLRSTPDPPPGAPSRRHRRLR